MFELNSQSNYTPPFRAPEAIHWLAGIVSGLVEPLCLFPIYRGRAVHGHQSIFWVRALNGELEDREELHLAKSVLD